MSLPSTARGQEDAPASTAAAEDPLQQLVEGIPGLALFHLSAGGTVASWNAGGQRVFGYSAQEIVGQPFARLCCREDEAGLAAEQELSRARADGRSESSGWRCRKGGERFWAEVTVGAVPGGFSVAVRDRGRAPHEGAVLPSMLDAAKESIALFDSDGVVCRANATAFERLGMPAGKVVGRNLSEFGPPEVWQERLRRLREVVASGKPVEFQDHREGMDFTHRLFPVFDAQGAVSQVVSFSQDVTERTHAREALERERSLLRSVLQATDVQLVYLDRDFRFVWVNDAYAAATRRPADELVGREHFVLFPHPENEAIFRRVRDTGEPVFFKDKPFEYPDQPERGVTYWDWSLYPARGARGEVLGLVFSLRETTQYVRAREQLLGEVRRQAAERDAILQSMADGLIVCGPAGEVVRANPAVTQLLGYAAEELSQEVGRRIEQVELRAEDGSLLAPEQTANQRALRGETVRNMTQQVRRSDGETRWLSVSSAPVRNGERISGAVVTVTDITERKRAERELREADRRKSEFLAVLSHELRNPLAPIRNSTYLLGRSAGLDERGRRATAVIERQVDHLTHLVDDLLDVTRISSGKIRLQRTRLDLVELARKTLDDHRSVLRGHRIVTGFPDGRLEVEGDPTRLAQVVGNLLQNAGKFTPNGREIRLSVRGEGGLALLEVEDQGVGIDSETLGRLFEPFSQGDRSLDRSLGGLGLGLALVKGIVELHGGSVLARSEGPGRGACFRVAVPLFRAQEAADDRSGPTRTSADESSAKRVLVIEDNKDAADTLADVLSLSGNKVEVAYSGAEGLAKAREVVPDVIVCDLGLPGLDGFEVARTLRQDKALATVYLIALTGYAQPEDKRRALNAGFDAHASKPPDLVALEALVAGAPGRH